MGIGMEAQDKLPPGSTQKWQKAANRQGRGLCSRGDGEVSDQTPAVEDLEVKERGSYL